jgi:hypothetical protein
MWFEVVLLKLTHTINPGDQVKLEAHLRWNAILHQRSGIAFSLEGMYNTLELGEGQGVASLRGNTLPPNFFLLDALDEVQNLS